MKLEPRIIQFPDAYAAVIVKNERSAATGKMHAGIYVQCIDTYQYQREWTLAFIHKPGDSKTTYWESRIYQHPGRRAECQVKPAMAEACIRRFLDLCDNYPNLLFSGDGVILGHGRSEGFVHFAEALHRGALPSKTLL